MDRFYTIPRRRLTDCSLPTLPDKR
ncbi:hypothetical protein LINPERHAP1_LOCUS13671 [Linum perenne]